MPSSCHSTIIIVQSMRRRNNLFKRAKRVSCPSLKTQYKRARNKLTAQLRHAKSEFFANLDPSNTKQFWKTVKTLSKKDASVSTLTHEGATCHSDLQKVNALNNFFSSCFNSFSEPISMTPQHQNPECSPDMLCTQEAVYKLLNSLNINKASGPDGISARMLKATADAIAPSVTNLFNLSIKCCRPPSSWKISSVVPIPKVQRPSATSDFRPISLLSILSKVLERHFHFLITEHLQTHYPLSNCQWGFQQGKSTVTALLHVTHDWLQYLEKGHEISAVFFDFRKAFDTVPHLPLLSKLQKIGLDPLIITWIQNYLAERYQKVVLNGKSSHSAHVTSGVPQGSILGPLLFLIYINDISKVSLSEGSKLVLYADDMLLYHPISNNDDYSALQSDINSISNWTSSNGMSFNTTKCKCMTISRKRNPSSFSRLMLNGSWLEEVPMFKYLGVTLSSDLSWSPHIQGVCSKARKIVGLLYRRYSQHSNSQVLVKLYTSLVRPHMEYAASVWDPHHVCDITRIEGVQKFALRMCCKQWDAGYSDLLNMFDLPSLENRRLYLKLCQLFKIVHNLCHYPPGTVALRTTPSHATRSLMLQQPFTRTNSLFHSFVPESIRKWNNLPNYVVQSPNLNSFKSSLRVFML